MGRRKQKKPGRPRRQPEPLFDGHDELVIASALRTSCSDCSSTHIQWGDVAAGVWGARTDSQRAGFTEAVAAGLGTSWTAWWCMDCEGIGIFSPTYSY